METSIKEVFEFLLGSLNILIRYEDKRNTRDMVSGSAKFLKFRGVLEHRSIIPRWSCLSRNQ